MFAALVLEREPTTWAQLPEVLIAWLQSAGGVAAFGICIFLALTLSHRAFGQGGGRGADYRFARFIPFALLGFVPYVFKLLPDELALAIAGGVALLGVSLPLIINLVTRVTWRRIWAIAKVSLKEAIRSRVVIVFGIMALVFLFADWFVAYKEQDQVRNYTRVVYWSIAPLFLMTGTLLGAFSIPNDIKNQSIQTVVTKPVEKIEIVLGRFLGYGTLLTVALIGVTCLSYVYILRGVTPEAARESFKARVPVFAGLEFFNTKGENVGREFDYRRYISGPHPSAPGAPKQYAVFSFLNSPDGNIEMAPFEVTADIFRLTKGEEGKGVYCTFTVADGHLSVPEIEDRAERLKRERIDLRKKVANPGQLEEYLAEKFRVHEIGGVELKDYHTQELLVPGSFFKALAAHPVPKQPGSQQQGAPPTPAFKIVVNVDRISGSQMVGFAPRDFYLLETERPFWQNFVKGIIGLWLLFLLALGVAIACSTYLSGVISWLAVLFLLLVGLPRDSINQLAENRAVGGGPFASLTRIANKQPISAPLDETAGTDVVKGLDEAFSWYLRKFLNLIPDVNRFDLNSYVGNGFDASWGEVIFIDCFLYWLGYLIPWLILAFYLLRFREIAIPT